MKFVTLVCSLLFCLPSFGQEKFPDGTLIPDWFRQNEIVNIETLGGKYKITDHGVVNDSTLLQTEKIQAVIDQASSKGGGVIIIPKGTYLSGALFFKPKTHLYLEEGAVLKGSDDISNFPIINTRIEGQSLKYFAALVNADKVDGFTISGKGTINATDYAIGNLSGCAAPLFRNARIWMSCARAWCTFPTAMMYSFPVYASSTLLSGRHTFTNVTM